MANSLLSQTYQPDLGKMAQDTNLTGMCRSTAFVPQEKQGAQGTIHLVWAHLKLDPVKN